MRIRSNTDSKEELFKIFHVSVNGCDCFSGIVGHLGAVFSEIYGNRIHRIHHKMTYHGAEVSGIKLHASLDVNIHHNVFYSCYRAVWFDWQVQGTHLHHNLFAGQFVINPARGSAKLTIDPQALRGLSTVIVTSVLLGKAYHAEQRFEEGSFLSRPVESNMKESLDV